MPQDMSDNERFLALLVSHQKRIYAYILSLVPRTTDAEEIMQQTTIAMWKKFASFEQNTNFLAWGIQVAKYHVLKFRARQAKNHRIFEPEVLEKISESQQNRPSKQDDRLLALDVCLKKLDSSHHHMLQMRYDEGLKINEIAEKVGRSVYTLYKTFAKIHTLLQLCIHRTMSAWEAKG